MREEIFRHMLKQPLGYFSTRHSSDLTSRVINDVAQFEYSTLTMLQLLLKDVCIIVILTGWMFKLNWMLALVCWSLGLDRFNHRAHVFSVIPASAGHV